MATKGKGPREEIWQETDFRDIDPYSENLRLNVERGRQAYRRDFSFSASTPARFQADTIDLRVVARTREAEFRQGNQVIRHRD